MPAEVSDGASDDYLEDWGLNPSAFDDLKGNHVDVPNSAGTDQGSDCCDEMIEPCDKTGDPRTVSETINDALAGVDYRLYVQVEGVVERHDAQFDVVSITLPKNIPGSWAVSPLTTQNYFFEGLDQNLGCGSMEQENQTRLILLSGGTPVDVEFWPRDARFHKEAEAEIPATGTVSFKDAFQANPGLY